ncbi:Sec-independent protein translocase protein TatB [Sphingomonas endolithica]|uniref:Sec-independent protein translocase protein TatB n=1 Tax=Sphingomonas endolithica TaxID=2972485 RepID=UPI0021AFF574|nr:Sec-independent protein translocase protein TatB [Sphingomonas sp. ZFBP2030]
MFDVAPTELLLVAMVALVVIGPKDLPKAMRFVGFWVGRARGVMRQFRSGFDSMVREAELHEMEKKWAAENERIMREHQPSTDHSVPEVIVQDHDVVEHAAAGEPPVAGDPPPVMVEQPAMIEQPIRPQVPDSADVPAHHPSAVEAASPTTDPKTAS